MNQSAQSYVAPGMPALELGEKTTSIYEFWPTWLMYAPVAAQWSAQALWHRSLTLPLVANPALPLSGMVGVPKSQLFEQAKGKCKEAILDWVVHEVSSDSLDTQIAKAVELARTQGIEYPMVCKPDIGCRGSGVRLVHNDSELRACIESYPIGSPLLLQRVSDWEPEVGIFFVKEPGAQQGQIVSMALKYSPYVVGDGHKTLGQLINEDPRAGELVHLYQQRHADQLDRVLADGEAFKLVFSASHCRGAIFRDARDLVTEELCASVNELMDDLPEFYYGRMDIKFKDVASLKAGKTLQIVEINAASSESLHIWDKDTPLKEAFSSLLFQYRTLFKLGDMNRKRGYQPPKLKDLWKAWRREKALHAYYPSTD